jgi:hypothetical protein
MFANITIYLKHIKQKTSLRAEFLSFILERLIFYQMTIKASNFTFMIKIKNDVFMNLWKQTMEELVKLEQLSLISKVCTELENHLNISDKDLGKCLQNSSMNYQIEFEFLDQAIKFQLSSSSHWPRRTQHSRSSKKLLQKMAQIFQ